MAVHSYNLDHNPVVAHWEATAAAVSFGMLLAMARGAFVAFITPPGRRTAAFVTITRGVAPLYCIPFCLGAQWDCYETIAERRGRPKGMQSHDVSDMA